MNKTISALPDPAVLFGDPPAGTLSLLVCAAIVLGLLLLALSCFLKWRRQCQAIRMLREATEMIAPGESAPLPKDGNDDLTGLAVAIESIANSRDEALRTNQSGRQFLAAASHDLRQPLQALGLFVATLSGLDLPEAQRRIVAKIEGSLEALDHLLSSLLDISRLDAGAVRAHRAIFPVQDLFARLALEFVPLAESKSLSMRFVPTPALTHSDPELLERILRNLVSNALRYTAKGGVVVGARRRGTELRIEVWDTGCGIPPDKQKDVFREFRQLNEPPRSGHDGLGLGLAIVERLASLLGHRVALRSVPDRGSVFVVVVPLVPGDASDGVPDAKRR